MANWWAAKRKKIDFVTIVHRICIFRSLDSPHARQTADQAWLHYTGSHRAAVPASVRALGKDPLEAVGRATNSSAASPALTGARGRKWRRRAKPSSGTLDGSAQSFSATRRCPHILSLTDSGSIGLSGTGMPLFIVAGVRPARRALRRLRLSCAAFATDDDLTHLNADPKSPAMPIRWVDEWDNPNGTVERGYGGPVDLL